MRKKFHYKPFCRGALLIKFLLTLLVFVFFRCVAQTDTLLIVPEHRKSIIKTTLDLPGGYASPALEIAYEKSTGKHFSSQAGFSYIISMDNYVKGFDYNQKGFKCTIEERYYTKSQDLTGNYWGFGVRYVFTTYNYIGRFGQTNDFFDTLDLNYFDTVSVRKQTFSTYILLGYQEHFKRWHLDTNIGFGLRYKDVRHFNKINPAEPMAGTLEPQYFAIVNTPGYFWVPVFILHVTIGLSNI